MKKFDEKVVIFLFNFNRVNKIVSGEILSTLLINAAVSNEVKERISFRNTQKIMSKELAVDFLPVLTEKDEVKVNRGFSFRSGKKKNKKSGAIFNVK